MRLLMIESDAKGIWYFTGLQECADFLKVSYNTIRMWNKGVTKTCRGFTSIEWIEDDNIISRFINPSRQRYIETYGDDN
jgi:hypothetical protein